MMVILILFLIGEFKFGFYLNNGAADPVFSQQLINIGVSDPYYMRVLDFDNDTDLDIFIMLIHSIK